METQLTSLRSIPSVDLLLQNPAAVRLIAAYGRPLTLEALRQIIDEIRAAFTPGQPVPPGDQILERVAARLAHWTAPTLQPVINATGVVLHTNLGRAPLSPAALQAAREASLGYSTLEFDLEKGQRGSRLLHAEALLQRLTGAEAALVVNNNAAAVLLVLTALAKRRSVVISRTQLVEIGGGFRVPDVMVQSGARLLEIGATNRVHLSDYELALQENPALILRAHRSNFQITGFTSEPSLTEIAALAQSAGLPLVDDLGSGALLDTARFGLAHEPMVQESLAAGADLVCFSGDKLLGGPQAGIIIGRAALVAKLRKHPLARAIRADKLCLAALGATLLHYLKDEALQAVPLWQMFSAAPDAIRQRAQNWLDHLANSLAAPAAARVVAGLSTIGGGSLPGETLPTYLLALAVPSPNRFLARLRRLHPPIIARLQDDQVVLDPRTVLPDQEDILLLNLSQALKEQ